MITAIWEKVFPSELQPSDILSKYLILDKMALDILEPGLWIFDLIKLSVSNSRIDLHLLISKPQSFQYIF